VIAP